MNNEKRTEKEVEDIERDSLPRGIATVEEINRLQKKRELNKRFGLELNY